MNEQICWKVIEDRGDDKILHCRLNSTCEWEPWWNFPAALKFEREGQVNLINEDSVLQEWCGSQLSSIGFTPGFQAWRGLLKAGWEPVLPDGSPIPAKSHTPYTALEV